MNQKQGLANNKLTSTEATLQSKTLFATLTRRKLLAYSSQKNNRRTISNRNYMK